MAEKTSADVALAAKPAPLKPSRTNGGECSTTTTGIQLSQSSPSSVIEDSGTESGEDLRLLNPELLAEVRGALSKLENALPTLDTARRASIIPLVNKLQSCLKVSAETGSSIPSSLPGVGTISQPTITSSSPSLISSSPASSSTITTAAAPATAKRFSNKQRKSRHTVGVSKAELADARKWIAENFLEDSVPPPTTTANHLRYESKTYKPVKFTPIPPRESRAEPSKYPLDYGYFEAPPVHRSSIVDPPTPMLAYQSYDHFAAYPLPAVDDRRPLRKPNYSSDEGDVSSTEEETIVVTSGAPAAHNAEAICPTAKPWLTGSSQYDKKIPLRFHQKSNKKIRMKRANTIDIPKLSDIVPTSSGDESVYRSADERRRRDKNVAYRPDPEHEKLPPPTLRPKTDKDRKFVDFVRQTMRDDRQHQTKMVAYNPSAAGGGQWSNRFTNIKCAFEQPTGCGGNARKSTSSPDLFKPVATKTYPSADAPKSSFSHAHLSPFKPVPPSRIASARDSGYESRRDSYHHFDHQMHNLPKQFFTALERQALQQQYRQQQKTPKTYYAPANATVVDPLPRQQRIPHPYDLGGYLSDGSAQYPYHTNSYVHQPPTYVPAKLTIPDNAYYTQPASYFYQEPTTAPGAAFISPPPTAAFISPPPTAIPVSCSSSPTNRSYVSLPTSPLPPARHPDYCEERPAVAKIMGQPQQAIVVPNKSNYRNPAAAAATNSAHPAGYQQNLQKAAPQQNRSTAIAVPPPSDKTPPPVRKQVRIIALNDDEENLPEQFHVLNQRNKFESMSVGGNVPRPLPPQINEKAFFKPLTVAASSASVAAHSKRAAAAKPPPVVVEQNRSPPQSPIVMPSVLQKSESWHQMIMERTKQAKPPSPIKPKVQRAKSTHNLATIPKQYEAVLSPESVRAKKETVEQFMGKASSQSRDTSRHSSGKIITEKRTTVICADGASTSATTTTKDVVNKYDDGDDLKHVDEEFEILFKEASGKKT